MKTHSFYEEFDNLPNRITLFRFFLIPIIIGCLYLTTTEFPFAKMNQSTLNWLAGWTFGVAGITDFFDGYIARKRNLITMFGSFLDPIADKFLVVSSLVVLLHLGRVDVFVVIILVLRELYMTSLRLLAQNEGLSVPVNNIGKFKTATQMVGIPFIMTNASVLNISLPVLGEILLFVATFLSIFSSVVYSLSLLKKLKIKRMQKHENRNYE